MPFFGQAANAPVYAGTWASKPAASAVAVGARALFTDLGYTEWFSDGSNWYPVGGRTVLGMQATAVSMGATPGTTEIVIWQCSVPAGLIVPGKTIVRYMQSVEKSGGTSDTLTSRLRLGTSGNTSDASLGLGVTLATTASTASNLNHAVVPSATTVRRSGSGGGNNTATAWSSTNTTARPAAVTIPNVSNALTFSATGAMATGSAETGEFDGGLIELFMRP